MRLMALFSEKEARDELGIGGIRDAISDQLFPGTSTIQTRLRYFLFIPWLFEALDARGVGSTKFADAARNAEDQLRVQLVENEQIQDGIIGRRARGLLKRMPSSVYWSGLQAWGIREYAGSLQQYQQDADERRPGRPPARRATETDGDAASVDRAWRLEAVQLRPVDFPMGADMAIRREEALFLLERWRACQPDSLLTWLALELQEAPVLPIAGRIWEHPYATKFPAALKGLVAQAQRLDVLVRGAALLYNLQLAEMEGREALVESYTKELDGWTRGEAMLVHAWDPDDLWTRVMDKGHGITLKTKSFVEEWLLAVKALRHRLGASQRARALIRARESDLKGMSSSRFENAAARRQWGGRAGLAPMDFRWPTVDTYIREWHSGLHGVVQ